MGIFEVFFPKRCLGCGKTENYVCEECFVGIWEEEQICPTCGGKSKYGSRHKRCREAGLDGLVCMYAYAGMVKKGIETMKYRRCFDVIGEFLPTREEIKLRSDLSRFWDFTDNHNPLVVPVPLWPARERDRGFNQAKMMGERLGREFGINEKDLLIRIKDTGKQVGRNRAGRLGTMEGAFRINNKLRVHIDTPILLIDDVWTTGATLRECGKELKQAGFKKIWGWVLAR